MNIEEIIESAVGDIVVASLQGPITQAQEDRVRQRLINIYDLGVRAGEEYQKKQVTDQHYNATNNLLS